MSLFNKIKSVFNSSSDDVPDAQTIYFKNGEMYKVYPTDKESWYDARYLVSDGVKYDLENLDDLKRIPVGISVILDISLIFGHVKNACTKMSSRTSADIPFFMIITSKIINIIFLYLNIL